jgi:epoxyqueuosine reductase
VRRPDPLPSIEDIRARLGEHGVTHVGVTTADVLAEARTALVERRAAGLHGDMGFTYRDPERSTDPRRAVVGARSVIVAAAPYLTSEDPPRPDTRAPQARVGRYAWVDHYAPLRTALRDVCRRIRRSDHRAVAFADDNSIVDRAVAHRAGLGWYGKNANLLLPGAGSWFVLGSIVTTAPYEPSTAPAPDGCGSCVRCIDACPTAAIVGPGVIDANRCISWILQKPGTIPEAYRAAIGDRIYGCDDCQDACPVSVRLGRRNTVELDPRADAWVDALQLLEADDEWIDQRYGHWYVTDRDFRWVRRNALVVIGNVGDPADTRLRRVLEHYRAHIDPILAEHADWAVDRLAARSQAVAAP